ncbi:MAG: PorT family protein [Candidatus Azobacteroides sp.]|nr:PorT family protein [Candidatus Azobacteroides sp.]
MKKLILLSAALFLITNIHAQVRFGVKAGGNFSNLYTSGTDQRINGDQYKGRFSYHFGGVMEYSFTDIFSIQPELVYLNHGANLKSDNSFAMKDGHITLNTLQLPVNLKATFHVNKTKLFVYAGPYIGYHMYGKATGKTDGETVDQELFTKESKMRRLDYGIGFGVGTELDKFTLTLGNQRGIQDISGEKSGRMKAGNITLSVGYFF